MDWISISTSCFAASNAIAKTSAAVNSFVREVRESRVQLDAISCELHSLDGVLDLLKDDAGLFPPALASQTPRVLEHCASVVNELGGYLTLPTGRLAARLDNKSRWLTTRRHMARLQLTLEGYKSTLGMALDLIELTKQPDAGVGDPRSVKEQIMERISYDHSSQREASRLASDLCHLRTKLRLECQNNSALFGLLGYLDVLQAHGATYGIEVNRSSMSTFAADGVDADIDGDTNESPTYTVFKQRDLSLAIQEMDELLDELNDMPSRAPTPPPRAAARRITVRDSAVSQILEQRPRSASESDYIPIGLDGQPMVIPDRMSSIRPLNVGLPNRLHKGLHNGVVSGIDSASDSASVETEPAQPGRSSRMGRIFGHVRNALSEGSHRSLDTNETIPQTPQTPSETTDQTRRRSTLLSSPSKPFSSWKSSDRDSMIALEADIVFGVSLKKSMQVARASAKTHHSGSGSSRREFPLCIMKCYSFIKESGGTSAPHIFGEPGHSGALRHLREVFNTPPSYGERIDWRDYSVYEAADLILLFLSLLPKPLVSESVAKRWLALSKQANLTGQHALDQDLRCIDFWEDALGAMRGAGRTLFKLLLNLWGDVANAADVNDMTAERLAGRIIKPLMHAIPTRHETDFLLAMAFLIRKRSEYNDLLRGGAGKGKNKAFT